MKLKVQTSQLVMGTNNTDKERPIITLEVTRTIQEATMDNMVVDNMLLTRESTKLGTIPELEDIPLRPMLLLQEHQICRFPVQGNTEMPRSRPKRRRA